MARVYVSGPMSNLPDNNYPAFHEAAARWRAAGHEVVNPAELDEADDDELSEDKTWCDFMRRDLAMLVGCDSIVMLSGWERSRGALLERYVAAELEMPIYYDVEGVAGVDPA